MILTWPTDERQQMYYTNAVRETAPPPALRDQRTDYDALTLAEQMHVTWCLDCHEPLSAVPPRGQVFLRRHFPEVK